MNIIKVRTKNKSTTIRISERAKKMLETLAKGKETHEEIILRLIKLANGISSEYGSRIIEKGNIIGTKYERINKTFEIEIGSRKYTIVCTYNDLSIIVLLGNNQLKNYVRPNTSMEWELDLEIVNIDNGTGWIKPTALESQETKLLYSICLKRTLEEIFDIDLYELETENDYLNIMKWTEAYNRNNLSRDSLRSDVKERLR